ncbi:ABC transporter ATP-binding protein [Streptomyces sp. NPDC048278]|uniref:ABC transporter ATP-binding protein n=1 Tax=Streptomyces sp. NPDC048278 TaxID=3155809 RepID=UPI0034462492
MTSTESRGRIPAGREPEYWNLSGVAVFKRFWPYLQKERLRLLAAIALALVSAAGETVVIGLFAHMTDHVLVSGSFHDFTRTASLWVAVAAVSAATSFGAGLITVWTGEKFLLQLRDRMLAHVLRLPPDFFGQGRLGDLMARFTGDIEAVEALVASGPVQVVSALFSALFFAGAAVWLSPSLALVTFAAGPLFWWASRRFSTRIRAVSGKERAAHGALTTVLEESLANVELVQAYNQQDAQSTRVHREGARWMGTAVAQARLAGVYAPLAAMLETVCVLTVIGAGAWEISSGRMSVGGLMGFAAFVGYLYPQIQSLGGLAVTASSAAAACERVLYVLDAPASIGDRGPAAASGTGIEPGGASPGKRTVVQFDRVGFSYPHHARQAGVDDVSFTVTSGGLTLVTGPSGAGKTTLTKLLLRFYDPACGHILLNGRDIMELSVTQVRDLITLLPQQTAVFHGTVAENIAYGNPKASGKQIRSAARAAGLDAVVEDILPDGYRTVVGPGGRQLSGGQSRRLALARALARETPVVVLDEPTAGLDVASARSFFKTIRRLAAERAVIVITHDLHLAEDTDTVLVMDHGRLIDDGRHHHSRQHAA